MTSEKPKIGSQTKAVTERKMRAAIIKSLWSWLKMCMLVMIWWHICTMLVMKNSSLSLGDRTMQKECIAGLNTVLNWISTLLHVFDTDFLQLGIDFAISQTGFPLGLSCMHCRSHTRMCVCTPTHIRKLISTIGCETLGAPVCCFQFRATTVSERGRESLCDIRPWDRKRSRVWQD